MSMAPFTLSLMGSGHLHHLRRQPEKPAERRADGVGREVSATCSAPPSSQPHPSASRPTRHRVTSHYNAFQTNCSVSTDEPPSYVQASRSRPNVARLSASSDEALPSYSCSVAAECKVHLSLESVNPLSHVGEGEWREVYAVLRGTLLSFHAVRDGGPGKLLRTYTLQHAEVGLASDAQHVILEPQTRLARLIPSSARRRAWTRDPDLFKPVRLNILRLRAETDQILLADPSEEQIHSLIYALSAAIDISQPIDDRSIPRQCTVPRRRRRQQRAHFNGDLADPALLAEQERIVRQMYPGLAAETAETTEARDDAPTADSQAPEAHGEPPSSPAREEEEIDFSMIREETAASAARPRSGDFNRRPMTTRTTTSTTMDSVFTDNMIYVTSTNNFTSEGKWQPPHTRSAAQAQRYLRRCMPVLLADASRASDIVIRDGRRMKINWRMELLEDWELQPPAYKAHSFDASGGLARTHSQRSSSGSRRQDAHPSQSSIHAAEDDHIAQAEQRLEHLQLSKTVSATTTNNDKIESASPAAGNKGRTRAADAPDLHGVVFCF